MQCTGRVDDISLDYKTRKPKLTLLLNENVNIEEVQNVDKLSIELKKFRNKRSLDANSYMWVLLQEMADILNTTKDELYIEVLGRYGVFTHMVVKQNVVDRVKEEWRLCKELGEVTINGKMGIQLQCYFGSSTYDSKEMSVLINRVVNECKELGIDTLDETELLSLVKEWDK